MAHTCHSEHCDHSDDGPNRGAEYSLYLQIDSHKVTCLNTNSNDEGYKVFKAWDDRFDLSFTLDSADDEQIIIYIPFTAQVKLKSIAVLGVESEAPDVLKMYANRDDVDFDSVDSIDCTQELSLLRDIPHGTVAEYPTKVAKFSSLHCLTLFFPSNFSGSDRTRISYIGLKGEFTQINRDPVIAIYEASADLADHPMTNTTQNMNHSIH
jgi:hypothetical protein